MQIPFKPNCSVAEYAERGKRFDFPEIKRCPNRKCRNQTMHKHGFYERNCCDGFTWHRIFVRRYCCPSCGATVSFLPLFCLPWFQYSLACLWRCLLARFIDGLSCGSLRADTQLYLGRHHRLAATAPGFWRTYRS